jgi:enhancer of yellow 2 transcription factor
MAKDAAINRPPTPEAEEDREFSLEEKIRYQLLASGERDKLKSLLREKLNECGWKEEIKILSREYVQKKGRDNVSIEDIVRAIRPEGRAAVPDSVKAELLSQIKKFIISL